MPPNMTTLVKIQRKGQMTLPSHLRSAIGVEDGDVVEAKLWRGTIVITPKAIKDLLPYSKADNEYTAEQRRTIDARLDKADDEINAGQMHGPFTAKQARVYIERLAKERAAVAKGSKPKRPPR